MMDQARIEGVRRPVKAVDRDRNFLLVISTIANKISRGGSRLYLQLFGLGIIEWRVLGVLAGHRGTTAQSICNQIDLDKAAASRSLQVLERRGYVAVTAHPKDARKRKLSLTPAGQALHDRMQPISAEREQRLLRGFSEAERELLMNLLRRLYANAVEMDDRDYAADRPAPRAARARPTAVA
jgi:DNA-binding MarR family transcriptional regulator